MLFAINCTDKENSLELRMATRPAHLAYLNQFAARLVLAGPLSADGKPAGSLIIVDVESAAAAEAFIADDPYALAGLFATVTMQPFRIVFQDGKQVS